MKCDEIAAVATAVTATLFSPPLPSQCSSVKLRFCVARDAWNSLGNMTKEEAMMNYVDDIQLVSPFNKN